MRFAHIGLIGLFAFASYSSGNNYLSRPDERSDLIARMKKTMASQDSKLQDTRDLRDRIVTTNECALLLDDLGLKEEFPYDSGAVSIGPEKNGSDISIFISVGTYVTLKTITLDRARDYLNKREKKK